MKLYDRIPEIKMATTMFNVINTVIHPSVTRREGRHKNGIYCSCDLHNIYVELIT
jgi:hypothetical protein